MPSDKQLLLYLAPGDPQKWAKLAGEVGLYLDRGIHKGQPSVSALGRLIAANYDNQRLVDLLRALAQKGNE